MCSTNNEHKRVKSTGPLAGNAKGTLRGEAQRMSMDYKRAATSQRARIPNKPPIPPHPYIPLFPCTKTIYIYILYYVIIYNTIL